MPEADNGALGVALLGLGTVGSAVFDVLDTRRTRVGMGAGGPVEVRRILVRRPDKRRPAHAMPLLTFSPDDVFDDPSVSIVVELVGCPCGDPRPALSFIRKALERGKHVVTANKQVLAGHTGELSRLASARGVTLFYEGAVGGAIPVIRAIRDSLAADRVSTITGILNGTTNYILTEMSRRKTGYRKALRQAQQLGYAEADPSSDVEGHDAAYKISLLAGLCFGRDVDPAGISREGITGITHDDVAAAARFGYVVKLLATARANGGRPEVRVYPALLRPEHPLSRVDGPFNAVAIKCDLAGNLVFYGQGAGGVPTASAVVADIINAALIARGRTTGSPFSADRDLQRVPEPTGAPHDRESGELKDDDCDEAAQPYFIHIRMPGQAALTRRVRAILKECGVQSRNRGPLREARLGTAGSVCAGAVHAGPAGKTGTWVSAGIVTEPAAHRDIQACVSRLAQLRPVRARAFRIDTEPEPTPR